MKIPASIKRILTDGQTRTILLGFVVLGFAGQYTMDEWRTYRNVQRFTELRNQAIANRQRIDQAVLQIQNLVIDSPRRSDTDTLSVHLNSLKEELADLKKKVNFILAEDRKREVEAWSPSKRKK